jgi:glycosyltransferase involved in cell wall biosynthesis
MSTAPLRRVLILCYDFPPRGSTSVLRVTKFVRYLPQFGWQPVVVTAAVRGGMRDEALLAQLPTDLEALRVENRFTAGAVEPSTASAASAGRPALRARLRRSLRAAFIPDPQILWVPAAVQTASARIRQGDIAALLTTAPPFSVQLAGLWLKRRFPALPWIMDMRDIWSENPAIASPPIYKLQRAAERWCVEHADRIITATDGQRRLIEQSFGLPAARLRTITNGFDPLDVPQLAPAQTRTALRLTYVGSIIGTRAAAAAGFFAALRALAAGGVTAQQLEVRLIGIFDPSIHAWAAPLVEQGIVQLLPFMPYADAYAEMAAADALLLTTSDDREGRLSHPNQLFEYFAVGRPLLALTPPGDVARLVQEAGVGVVASPGATNQIVAALRELLAEHQAGRLRRFAPNDPRFARFERQALTAQLAAELDELTR